MDNGLLLFSWYVYENKTNETLTQENRFVLSSLIYNNKAIAAN